MDTKARTAEKRKQYRMNNHDKLLKQHREYNATHKDERKQYRINNREAIREYNKQYRTHKEQCTCGRAVSRNNKLKHLQTAYHINNSPQSDKI